MTDNEFVLSQFYKESSFWENELEENKDEKKYFSDDPNDYELVYFRTIPQYMLPKKQNVAVLATLAH